MNGTRVTIVVPDLGVPMVRLSLWFAEPGDRVYVGERLVEVVTDGASFDVPAPVTGHLADRTAFARDALHAGQILGTILADPEE